LVARKKALDFAAFRTQFATFDEFRKPFEGKFIGLRHAVATGIRAYLKDSSGGEDAAVTDGRLSDFFEMVDDAEITQRKIVTATRRRSDEENGNVYGLLLNRWSRDPSKLKSMPRDDTECLIVFYYFTHCVDDEDGNPRDRYWHLIVEKLGLGPEILDYDRDEFSKDNGTDEAVESAQSSIDRHPGFSPTDRLLKIRDLFVGDRDVQSLFSRINYSERPDAFEFDPETFRHSEDERALDDMLLSLSLAGGMMRRGEINLADAMCIRTFVQVLMGSKQVHAYLAWLHREDQLPDHVDYLDAVHLHKRLVGSDLQPLNDYGERAGSVVASITAKLPSH